MLEPDIQSLADDTADDTTDVKRPKAIKASKVKMFSDLANPMEQGLNSVADSLKAVANSIGHSNNDEILETLREAKKARIEDQAVLRDMKSSLEQGNSVKLAILEQLKKNNSGCHT